MEQETLVHESGVGRSRVRVVLTNGRFQCTKCRRWKSAQAFGLRTMDNGTVRNQAQCKSCRAG